MGRKCKRARSKASQKTVCRMLKEAASDETKGKRFYRRLEQKLPKHSRKMIVSKIASQEGLHKKDIEALEKELMC